MDGKRFELPAGIEAKAWQFAAMCLRDGYPDAVLGVNDGEIATMSLFEEDGTQHYIRLVNGDLCEYDGEVA